MTPGDLPTEVERLLHDPNVYLEADQLALDRIRAWSGLNIDRHLWVVGGTDTATAPAEMTE